MIIALFLFFVLACETKPRVISSSVESTTEDSLSENTVSQSRDIDTITHKCFEATIPIVLNVLVSDSTQEENSEKAEDIKTVQINSDKDEYTFCVGCDDDSENDDNNPEQLNVDIDIDPLTGNINLTVKDFKIE